MTPKARTARLAGAEWGFGGPREAPAGVWGEAPTEEAERGAAPSTVAADFLRGLSRAHQAGTTP